LLEERVPDVLGIGQNHCDELRRFIARCIRVDLLRWPKLRLILGIDQCRRIAAQEKIGHDENDPADSAANRNATAARATHILNVVAFPSSLPEHRFEFGFRR
jgi:hypothetical protein